MSMTSHPVAFGTIGHTERAGELLGLLWQEVLRLQCDHKDALEPQSPTTADGPAALELSWVPLNKRDLNWHAHATTQLRAMHAALRQLVDVEDMRLRLRQLHEMGHGTDYTDYHRLLPLAWAAAREALGPNARVQAPP